jgi:hypothetical protein
MEPFGAVPPPFLVITCMSCLFLVEGLCVLRSRLTSDCDGHIPSLRCLAVAHDKDGVSWWLGLREGA